MREIDGLLFLATKTTRTDNAKSAAAAADAGSLMKLGRFMAEVV